MKEAATPRIVSREEWKQARAELLAREKEQTHASDALAAAQPGHPQIHQHEPRAPTLDHVEQLGSRPRLAHGQLPP